MMTLEHPRLAGKINRGSFSYRLEEQSGYEINDQLLEEKARTLFNNLFNQSYQAEGKDVLKSFVSENIPENLKGDKEAINAIDDLLFNSMGLTLDVSGDAVYNDKPVHVQLKQHLLIRWKIFSCTWLGLTNKIELSISMKLN